MKTNKLLSSFVSMGTRLVIFAALLVAFIGQVTGADAAPSLSMQTPVVTYVSGTLTYGSNVGSITYNVTLSRTASTPASVNPVVSGLPSGVSGSFSPSGSVNFSGATQTRTLTLTKTAALGTSAGSYTFSVQATGPGTPDPTLSGIPLTIAKASSTTAVTFEAGPYGYRGTPFTATAVATGVGGLNQSVPVVYTGDCTNITIANGCTGTATFGGDTNHNGSSNAQSITIVQGSQTINFAALPAKASDDLPFTVSATASSGLAVSFAASGNCTVAGNLVTLTGIGSCTITASQAGNTNYLAATNVARTFAISGPPVHLYAVTGTASFPGLASTAVWGYNTSNTPVTQPGGPVITINQGETVTIRLHNQLVGENTALFLQGQALIPDTTGVAPGSFKNYTFTASQPGTYLYEAGLITHAQHQVAMGLYGALVVRPTGFPTAPGQAYGSVTTSFDAEQVLVLSEFDTALTTLPNTPANFDMRKYAPKYFLINGKAYSNAAPTSIQVTAGSDVALRYVNAGLQSHAMSLLGISQTVIATDGNPFAYSHKMSSETIAPGQTLDVLVSTPSSAPDGSKFALYDANMLLRNNTGTGTSFGGLGGMLTFLTVGPPIVVGDTAGPLLSNLSLTPNPSDGTVSVGLSFTANDTTTGNNNVTAAEYWVDAGAHTPITVSGSPSSTKNLVAMIPPGLLAGTHIVSVRAQDSVGNWSTTGTINLVVDNVGPTTSGLALSPNPSNGAVSVNLSFTANDSASGNSNVTAAEYWIDSGAHTAVTIGSPVPVIILNATIASGLGAGSHVVHARSQDALGNWGAEAPTINLVIDNAGPTTTSVSSTYNPNNGSKPLNTSVQAVRVSASFSDAAFGSSNISNAEGFLDVAGTTGTGFVFIANDGNFNSPAEGGIADIPLVVVNALSTGSHPICVHAKDAAGNWGPMNCGYNLIIDRTPPTISSINRIGANPTNATSVQFLVTFSESMAGLTSSNFTIVRTGLTGTSTITSIVDGGAAWTVTATTGTGSGTIGLNLTSSAGITDVAGNALSATLPVVGQTFTITPPPQPSLYFSTSGNTNPGVPPIAGTADDADIYFYNTSTSAFTRSIDVTTAPYSLPSGANVDGFDRVDATHFYMSFDGNVTLPGGAGTVQDEDVVFYNAGTWSVYFDGTPGTRGLSGSDLDAINIVGGILYFSTDNTTVPTGVSGGGDDADIYSWNGTSFARVVDASVVGWSTTNVDGLVWVDATHVYLSYSSDTTAPGSLSVQDEDIVRNNGGTWSVYFDGTAVGLGSSGNLDIDAFDLP